MRQLPVIGLDGWQLLGLGLVAAVALLPVGISIGISAAIARALWIAATLGALRSEATDTPPD